MKLKFLDTIQMAFDKAQLIEAEVNEINAVIFSDHHRGRGDRADDYRFASNTYEHALNHYESLDSTLVLLGDIEELWENPIQDVHEYYRKITDRELTFEKKAKYLRLWGNHDSDWQSKTFVKKHLGIHRPVHEAVKIRVTNNGDVLGSIFLIHGHQGSTFSDQYAKISKFFVRYFWRFFQRVFNKPLDTAATNTRMRSKHDKRFYSWAREHNQNLIVITGHTHEPVFNSFTYADRLRLDYDRLLHKEAAGELSEEELKLWHEIQKRISELKKHDSTHLNPQGTAVPCYFNSGCCSYSDGEITGLEIMESEIRLIKWESGGERKVIQKENLIRIFDLLALDAKKVSEGIN